MNIKIIPTCFIALTPSSGSLQVLSAKVMNNWIDKKRGMEKSDESRTRRDEQRRKYSKMGKRTKDKLVRSPAENGGG